MKTTDIPKTKFNLLRLLVIIAINSILILIPYSFLGTLGLVIGLIIVGYTAKWQIVDDMSALQAGILMDKITGNIRVIFPGFNLKFFWEELQKNSKGQKFIDLKFEIEKTPEKTFPPKDGGKLLVKYIFKIRVNVYDENAEENVKKYFSYKTEAIETSGEALFDKLLASHFGAKETHYLVGHEDYVNQKVFGNKLVPNPSILDFERTHGVIVSIIVFDIDYDKNVEEAHNFVSTAEAMTKAMKLLVDAGWGEEEARNLVKKKFLPNSTETDINLNVHAPDLQNLRDFSILNARR